MTLWLTIILWTSLVNAAFFMPGLFGFGAIIGIIFFLLNLLSIKKISRSAMVSKGFWLGFWWGILIFVPQLYWVWSVLYHFSQRSFFLKIGVYCLLSSYFACTSACWVGSMMFIGWYVRRAAIRLIIYVLVTISYFIWLGNIGALILASGDGYPLLNPLIPLCAYRWFVQFVCLLSSMLVGPNHFYASLPTTCRIISLKPLVNQQNKYLAEPSVLGQQIYHHLCDIRNYFLYKKNQTKIVPVYCGAESFFPFSLNNYPELAALWGAAVQDNAILIIGAHYQQAEKVYQAVFYIQKGRIKKIYVKKHLVPFIEHTPNIWLAISENTNLLSDQREMFVTGKNAAYNKVFSVTNNSFMIPQICSEFIFSHSTKCLRRRMFRDKASCIIWLVNDSWFISSFKRILFLAGCLRGAWIGLPVILISHELMSNKCSVNRLGF